MSLDTTATDIPAPGELVPAANPDADALTLLARRRSVTAKTMTGPGPEGAALDALLVVAARVPDHRKVVPFRFVVLEGAARDRFGETVVRPAAQAREPDASARKLDEEAAQFARGGVVVAVVSAPDPDHKTPVWEQELTAGAVCQNLLIAANAAGWAGQWLTGWTAYDEAVTRALGIREGERVAGYIYLGTAEEPPKERARPDPAAITTRWAG